MRGLFSAAAAALLLAFVPDSSAHSIRRNPLSYVARLEEPVLHTPSNRIHAHSSFDLTFHLHHDQQKVRLSLEPNHDVISSLTTLSYIDADGNVQYQEPVDRRDHRVFKGDAFVQHPGHKEWINSGFARITVGRDGPKPVFHGVFRVNGNHHHIATSSSYTQTQVPGDPTIEVSDDDYMVVWRDTDIMSDDDMPGGSELKRSINPALSCSSDHLDFNNLDSHPVHAGLDLRRQSQAVDTRSLFGRQTDGVLGNNGAGVNLASTVGSTDGCPSSRKVALIGIATDCNYRAKFKSESDMRDNIIQLVNAASNVYEKTFNITIGLQNITTSAAECPGTPPSSTPWNVPCGNGVTITDRLNTFSQWRGSMPDTNAYWTLLSTCNTDAAVGLAWLGQACNQGGQTQGGDGNGANETIASANVVVRTDGTEWQVFAHESGHTFGAVHDCVQQTCSDGTVSMQKCCPLSGSSCDAGGQFIMNPSTSRGITAFSRCSIGNICGAMGRNSVNTGCLTDNRNVPTITGQQCGNGIVETGEDCDCGGEESCQGNTCCDPKTCKFKSGAVCDPSNEDCCTQQCQFSSGGQVCRSSSGACDPEEVCDGKTAICPKDVKADDGTGCGDGLACASGQCTSRDMQCKSLVGTLTSNNDTTSCNSQGCLLSCASPNLGPNACYNMQQYFLDGTPCDGGGKCQNGRCDGSNVVDQVGSWVKDNKNIVIPVASVVGSLIVLSLLSCLWSSCRRRRRVKAIPKANRPHMSYIGGHGAPMGNGPHHIARPPPAVPGSRGPPPTYLNQPYPSNHWQPPSMPPRTATGRYA